jgi:hypothetical protein
MVNMTDCPNCEHHKKRAQLWRDEAYKQAGHPLPERGWVGLTDEEMDEIWDNRGWYVPMFKAIEAKLKEKNG